MVIFRYVIINRFIDRYFSNGMTISEYIAKRGGYQIWAVFFIWSTEFLARLIGEERLGVC